MFTSTITSSRKQTTGNNAQFQTKAMNSVNSFLQWLEHFGELSQDQYDFWATDIGQWAKSSYYRNHKLGAIPVAPLVFLDAFLPASRKYFRKPHRFPIADAHYAMGYAYLYSTTGDEKFYTKATHFLEELEKTKCPGKEGYGWGYPFNWMTEAGLIKESTPLITTTPYVYEAHAALYNVSRDNTLSDIMKDVARHVAADYLDDQVDENAFACSYIPRDQLGYVKLRNVVNASAYRAFMLTEAAVRFENDHYYNIAKGNLNYVLSAQRPDGSWLYATDEQQSFIDHFHTCFVLKNLIKIEQLTGCRECREAIDRGIHFYLNHLIDENNLPLPFVKIERFVPFKQELYDYAESLNLAVLEKDNHPELNNIVDSLISDLTDRWQKPDGSFRTRKLHIGWNNVPYHRWAQAQLFRSLCFFLHTMTRENEMSRSLEN